MTTIHIEGWKMTDAAPQRRQPSLIWCSVRTKFTRAGRSPQAPPPFGRKKATVQSLWWHGARDHEHHLTFIAPSYLVRSWRYFWSWIRDKRKPKSILSGIHQPHTLHLIGNLFTPCDTFGSVFVIAHIIVRLLIFNDLTKGKWGVPRKKYSSNNRPDAEQWRDSKKSQQGNRPVINRAKCDKIANCAE